MTDEEAEKTLLLVVDSARYHVAAHHLALMRALEGHTAAVRIELVDGGARGLRADCIVLDDPHADLHTFEGEFREITEARMLAPAQNAVKNKGPQPRTKYPRRR